MPKFGPEGFGWLVADGRRYDQDLIVSVDGQVAARPKHLSKKYGGWHTVLGPEELEHVLEGRPEILLVACGHLGLLPIRPEVRALLQSRGIPMETRRLGSALARYRQLVQQGRRVAAVLHLTC